MRKLQIEDFSFQFSPFCPYTKYLSLFFQTLYMSVSLLIIVKRSSEGQTIQDREINIG